MSKKKIYMFFAGIVILLCIKTGYDMWGMSFRGIDKATQILFSDKYQHLWSEREDVTFSFDRDCGSTTATFNGIEMEAIIRTKNGFIPAEECQLDGNEPVYFIKEVTSSKFAWYYPSEPDGIYVSWYGGDYTIYPDKKITKKDVVQELDDEDYQLIEFFRTEDEQFRFLLRDVQSAVLKVKAVMLTTFIALAVIFLKLADIKKRSF